MFALELAALYMEVVPHAMREYRKEMRNSREATLTIPQFRIMAHLNQGPKNNRTLAEDQGVSVAAMSRMVDWLCKHGLVERLEHLEDRRQVRVQLTVFGRERYDYFRVQARLRMQKRIEKLSTQEMKNLNEGLSALALVVKRLGESPG